MEESEAKETAARFAARGYRKVSNKYRLVKRIDRPDWVEFLASELMRSPAELYRKGSPKPDAMWCDYYRRGYSKDELCLPAEVFRHMPSSRGDDCGYVPGEDEPGVDLEQTRRDRGYFVLKAREMIVSRSTEALVDEIAALMARLDDAETILNAPVARPMTLEERAYAYLRHISTISRLEWRDAEFFAERVLEKFINWDKEQGS